MLLGAACTGRVVAVMSSPPHRTWNSNDSGSKARTLENLWGSYESGDTGFRENLLAIQDMFLWSLSSAARGTAIPYLKELPSPGVAWSDTSAQGIRPDSFWSTEAWASFARWSRVELIEFCQGSLGHSWLHPTMIATNLPMKHLTGLPRKGNPQPTSSPRATGGTAWSIGFRKEVVEALDGKVKGPSLDELDSRISEGLRAATGSSAGTCDSDTQSDPAPPSYPNGQVSLPYDSSADVCVEALTLAQREEWRSHIMRGHVPYRRDCKFCVEGSGLGVQHRRIKNPQAYTLSVDLFGPMSGAEKGRDEQSVRVTLTLSSG